MLMVFIETVTCVFVPSVMIFWTFCQAQRTCSLIVLVLISCTSTRKIFHKTSHVSISTPVSQMVIFSNRVKNSLKGGVEHGQLSFSMGRGGEVLLCKLPPGSLGAHS